MYVGRFLVGGPGGAAYRVSSRSFPNRRIAADGDALAVVPTADARETTNPYVSYHCCRPGTAHATIGNGAHVDPIADKMGAGYPPRDALAMGLLTLDFEKDDYDTPRIAAIVQQASAHVGIVRRDALLVRAVEESTLVATYELDEPQPTPLPTAPADRAARAAYDADYDHPVCACGVTVGDERVETAIVNGPDRESG